MFIYKSAFLLIIALVIVTNSGCMKQYAKYDERFGAWDATAIPHTYGSGTATIIAKAKNPNTGALLGEVCIAGVSDKNFCMPFYNDGSPCEEGKKYRALISDSKNKQVVNMTCSLITRSTTVYVLPDEYHSVFLLTGKDKEINVVFEPPQGKPRKDRFLLLGAKQAITKARSLAGVPM